MKGLVRCHFVSLERVKKKLICVKIGKEDIKEHDKDPEKGNS
jgi:hypothetical protein